MDSLKGKKIYAFGDSIVYGHTHPEYSFMQQLAEKTGAVLTMCAVNGANICKSDNWILTQVAAAPEEKPDLILFDGYTNDAYEKVLQNLGTIQGPGASSYQTEDFCGGFEEILRSMRAKWGDVPCFFVTIHKSNARDWEIQTRLRELSLEICKRWNISVIDTFALSELDTRIPGVSEKYIIDSAGSHPNREACSKYYVPLVEKALASILA